MVLGLILFYKGTAAVVPRSNSDEPKNGVDKVFAVALFA
jgi:hypothetical protein